MVPVIDVFKCDGCGICVKQCPPQVIGLIQKKAAILADLCEECGICNDVCPVGAVQFSLPTKGGTSSTTATAPTSDGDNGLHAHLRRAALARLVMTLHVVDFSPVYFVDLLGEALPSKRRGKLVVVEGEGERYALFSPSKLSAYHANIVERFFSDRGLSFDNDAENGTTRPRSPGWVVAGGGRWELDAEAGALWIFGESMAYGRADLSRLASELADVSAFDGARVKIGSPPAPDR